MGAIKEAGNILPPEAYSAQVTLTAASVVAPELVAISLGVLTEAIDRRNQAADKLIEENRLKDIEICRAAAMSDARKFVSTNGLDSLFELKKGDAYFDFLRDCVADGILFATQNGRQFGGVVDRFRADKPILESASRAQTTEVNDFISGNNNSHRQQAGEINFLVQDLFSFLGKHVPSEQEILPVSKGKMNKWKRRWGFPVVTVSPESNVQITLWKRLSRGKQ
jgi:hypothetical protein